MVNSRKIMREDIMKKGIKERSHDQKNSARVCGVVRISAQWAKQRRVLGKCRMNDK